MAYVNIVDSSTSVSGASAGVQLDLSYCTTKSRSTLGVPVRLCVCAEASVAADTGAVKLVDSASADKLIVPINQLGEQWYVVDGYLPDGADKYDMLAGGNLTGSLKVYAWSLFQLMDTGPNAGVLASGIGNVTIAATGTHDRAGDLAATIAPITISADGTVAASLPSVVSVGTLATGTSSSDVTPTNPSHQTGDLLVLVMVSSGPNDYADPSGWSPLMLPIVATGNDPRLMVWGKVAASGAEANPTVVDVASDDAKIAMVFVVRGGSGDAVDSSTGASSTSQTCPSVTTTEDNALVINIVAHSIDITSSSQVSGWTNANLTGLTEIFDGSNAGGGGFGIGIATGVMATAGVTGTTSLTLASASAVACYTVAFKP